MRPSLRWKTYPPAMGGCKVNIYELLCFIRRKTRTYTQIDHYCVSCCHVWLYFVHAHAHAGNILRITCTTIRILTYSVSSKMVWTSHKVIALNYMELLQLFSHVVATTFLMWQEQFIGILTTPYLDCTCSTKRVSFI